MSTVALHPFGTIVWSTWACNRVVYVGMQAYVQFVNVKYADASPLKRLNISESSSRRDLFFKHGHDGTLTHDGCGL